jgi:hypothetical protein
MTYHITNYSLNQAKNLGVTIKPSKNKNKKIDVFKNNVKIASIGNINYLDYPTMIIKNKGDKSIANERRRLYKLRHKSDLKVVGSNGYYANKILW